jgi:probable HAF family extracellular repeat protein
MASAARPNARQRRRLAVAGAVVLVALMAGPAAAAMPPMEAAPGPAQPSTSDTRAVATGGSPRPDTRTPLPAFLLDKGSYTTFDAPGAVMQTGAAAINNLGMIAGNYVDADGAYHGFLRERRGRFITVDLPGALATQPSDLNDLGQMVGTYSTTARQPQAPDARPRGFLLDQGRFIRIDVPGAMLTRANGINNRRQVVGEYVDRAGRFHGFLWDKGRYTTVDVPGAAASGLLNVNDRGQLIGGYVKDLAEQPVTLHGFQLDKGRVTTLDAPPGPLTLAIGNNNRGRIVGAGTTGGVAAGGPVPTIRGFLLRRGPKGPFTLIAVPGAPNTLPSGINDLDQIVGGYQNPDVPSSPQAASGMRPPSAMSATPAAG